ncbi:lipid-A-disaccharide synthase [Pseudofulvimonas gallinarii]|jgi:lipid-A-disaccharide synthase|uniref:Lipid-A-disaccharide synthase n=1 Tax=Pseudofulvimonas gallinarii TaxID=634155 RepID=A0A4R3LIZ3_9GAMM|nr:lipid-A-disaccharide synthase [Pseudofulvimonas gallinarii]TCT00123.1 lipid-A-disaccharide synthase [Pseudofulvimonas gallinarii]
MASSPTSVPRQAPRRVALIAGEASGDQLGASLVTALKARWPDAVFAGVGGTQMRDAGMEQWSDYAPLAVMGIAEVLRHLPRLLRFRRKLVQRLADWSPDVVIGIDAPDFNLGVEKRLKRRGIATAHYVSPSVWAWRRKRAQRMGRSADRVLCLFPMEPPIYAGYGVDARFVGHPLADRFPDRPDRDGARRQLGIGERESVLAVLPGSRLGEIERLAGAFLEAARRVQRQRPGLRLIVPAANAACRQALQAHIDALDGGADIQLLDGQAHQAMVAADVLLLASGTAALEALLAKRPMIVGYRIAPLTYFLVKKLGMLKIERYSLPNILHGGDLVPEFMQDDCTADAIAPALLSLLDDEALRQRQIAGFDAIHASLRAPGGSAVAAAGAVAGLVESRAP